MKPESVIRYCYDYNIFIYGMIFFCVAGIVIKFRLLGSYYRLQKSLSEADRKSNKLILEISVKLKQAMKTQKKSLQVDTFVNKYVDERKSCGLLLSTWESICGQMSSLCLLIASCTGILGLIYQCEQSKILLTFLTGAWTAILVNIVNNIVSISRRKKNVILSLTEYINNTLMKEGMQVLEFNPNSLGELKGKILKTKRILRQQKRLALLKEEVECQKNLLAKELSESLDKERKALQKKEQQQKEKEDKLKEVEAKRQKRLEEKRARKAQKMETPEGAKHISFKERRKTRKLIKEQLRLEIEQEKKEKEEQKISARLKNEQEKERRRIAKREAKQGQEKESRAYEEKMRLKREKERAETIKQQEAARSDIDQPKSKREKAPVIEVPQESLVTSFDEPDVNSDYETDYEDGEKEAKEQAATSQEDEVLLEEVLKDFFN